MEKKLGVYICKGCGIGASLDIEKLGKTAAKETKIPAEIVKSHDILCSPEGCGMIKNDMKEGTNTLILAACSPRVKFEEFDFPGTITERVNIRELVAWSMQPNNDDTQMAANDYLKMGIIRTQKGSLPEPNILPDLSSAILVIGGGISGITAALEAANAGYQVVLVEKEAELGGWAAKLYKEAPRQYPYDKLDDPIIFSKIKEVESNPNIKIFKSSIV